ncbi:helix-turn-helix domain-containing protein [Flavobacterium sp. Fl-77]|uniref:Helix-turn-helix domain-containing protein n=1 Tax=Flavobacterium flavipigmentatum TaxID=2893884 RepID=A0AAJ2VYU2_9FLAO|nr:MULTISPECIES: helix-turn-helix domain-containing protein [unclassified Flavobacterium]MDX6183136.1 helix-turn-helix domain-containing protein [Flavobacterium sp. Fl-33]MDX6186795.1 helix-turn-helix domain-containing protein [Flavobacterium sp. Fl-77]UFH40449.1 helix-turn-helix domain-containing protein [Flavobacterium sp. F-70]
MEQLQQITLETLPKAFMHLLDEVKELKTLLIQKNRQPQSTADQWFDLNELCNYHPDKPKPATVYGWVFASKIPVNKGGKKLRFLKSEIDEWLKQGRKMTLVESSLKAEQYLKNQ